MKIYIIRRDYDNGEGYDISVSAAFTDRDAAEAWLSKARDANQRAEQAMDEEEKRSRAGIENAKLEGRELTSEEMDAWSADEPRHRKIENQIMADLKAELGGSDVGWCPDAKAYSMQIVEDGVPVVDCRDDE